MTARPGAAGRAGRLAALGAVLALVAGCVGEDTCGPAAAVVERVVDGDTIVLSTGEHVRYLMIDTPELSRGGGQGECFAAEARKLNGDLVLGRQVTLRYDAECTDRFGRLLAYVSVGEVEINRLLVSRGYACHLYIPPSGEDRRDEFIGLEARARRELRGMWGACEVVACSERLAGRGSGAQ